MTDIPVRSEQVEATGTDSSKSRWLAFLSLVLVGILCFEIDWLNNNIYRYDPWIEVIKPDSIDAAVEWIFGFFLLSVVTAFVSSKMKIMQVLHEPSRFLGKDHFDLLSHWLTASVVFCIGVAVFVIIVLNPAVHLDYAAEGEKPTVTHNGNPLHFEDTTIFLSTNPMELRNQNIEISDRHGFYRIKLAPSDLSSIRLLFSKHARIDLQKFFIPKDFTAELSDANNRDIGSFKFAYKSTNSLSEQCADSEPSFERHFSGGKCDGFFRELFKEISTSPGRMLEDTEGFIFYDDRKYGYHYNFGRTIKISITAPMAESAFGNKPLEAFDLYLNASSNDRRNLVEEFRKDTEVVSAAQLAGVFKSLASPERLSRELNGTVALRQASLSFVKDVLAPGVDHLTSTKKQELVEEIAATNLNKKVDSNSILLAIDTITALTRANYALDRLDTFVRDLGTDHNVLKPRIAGTLLRHFDDSMDHNEAKRVVSIIAGLWQSARGAKTAMDGIRSKVSDCLNRLSNDDLKQILREFDR